MEYLKNKQAVRKFHLLQFYTCYIMHSLLKEQSMRRQTGHKQQEAYRRNQAESNN
jgi:hypothetical protein